MCRVGAGGLARGARGRGRRVRSLRVLLVWAGGLFFFVGAFVLLDRPAGRRDQGLPGGSSVWGRNEEGRIVPLPSAAGLSLAGLGLVSLRRRR